MGTTENKHVVSILEALVYWYHRALKAEAELRELNGESE